MVKVYYFLKHKSLNFVLYVLNPEIVADVLYYFRNRYKSHVRRFPPLKRIIIDYKKDVNLVFFCGLGDAIYGFPVFNEIKNNCNINKTKLNACVPVSTGKVASKQLLDLLVSSKIFNEVKVYYGYETGYWKYYDWSDAICSDIETYYPFIYKTKRSFNKRIESISNQYGIKTKKKLNEFVFDLSVKGEKLKKKIIEINETIKDKSKEIVLCHFDARSGGYLHESCDEIIQMILDDGHVVITPESTMSKIKNNRLIKLNTEVDLLSMSIIINDLDVKIIAINSVFWPVGEMADATMLALHYLISPDGHHFYYDKMFFVTADKYTHKHTRRSIFAMDKLHYKVTENPFQIEYKPEFIWVLFNQMIGTSKNNT